jgi:hypothetical protein
VGTSKKLPQGDSQRGDVAQGTKVLHDGPAKIPACRDASAHKYVTGVQMARMRPLLAPATYNGSGDCNEAPALGRRLLYRLIIALHDEKADALRE